MTGELDIGVEPGERIGGRYELIELIGEGGMGAVWRARQLNLEREVALKLLVASHFESAEEARRRFRREAHVASAIKHPNVIEVYDVGEHGDLTFLAMELLQGISLRDRLAADELLSIEFVIDIGLDLASALRAAHQVGAVHRDLKPENIFLDHSGQALRVVILDFGLAFIAQDEKLGRMTQQGVVMGTPYYLSPEQARGRDVGSAADVYSLACVLYELLAGKALFTGSPLNVMTQHLYVNPDPVRAHRGQVPRELDDLVMAMLRKRPEERPRVGEVLEVLDLLASTLSGRRRRTRDAALLDSRAERMISFSPTAPLPVAAAGQALATRDQEIELRVAASDEVSEDIDLGLSSNGMLLEPWTGQPEDVDVILVIDTRGDAGRDAVRSAVATGLPVVAAITSDDRQAMGELARLGATELTTLPLMIDNLVRALRRAKRRHERRARGRRRKSEES